MSKIEDRVNELRLAKYGCAQVMVTMALETLGHENEEMVKAAKGLCGGMVTGITCGTFSGACLMMTLLDPAGIKETIPELTAFFRERCGRDSMNCFDIIDHDPANKPKICNALMADTFKAAADILEKRGVDMSYWK